jgi:hypothetical protein
MKRNEIFCSIVRGGTDLKESQVTAISKLIQEKQCVEQNFTDSGSRAKGSGKKNQSITGTIPERETEI